MNAKEKTTNVTIREKISILWIVVMFNMAFADIVAFIHPGALESMMNGDVGFELTQGLLLLFSVLIEVPIAMIFLSRILKVGANRWANIIAGVLTILFVVGGGSATLSYFFFASIEVLCVVLIVWYAWRLPRLESQVEFIPSANIATSVQ